MLALVCAITVALIMTVQGVLPAMPVLADRFGISDRDAGWFTLTYVLPGVFLTIPLGTAMARVPRRWAVAGGLTLYAVAGVLQAAAGSYEQLLALRAVQGVCFAATMPLTIVLIGEAYAGATQVGAFAVRQVAATVGEFALPVIGTALAVASWRAPLLAQGATLLVAAAALVILDDRRSPLAPEGARRRSSWRVIRSQPRGPMVVSIGFARFLFKFTVLAYLPALLVGSGAGVVEAGVVVSVAAGTAGLMASGVPRVLRRFAPARMAVVAALAIAAALAGFAVVHDWRAALAIGVCFGLGDGILAVLQDAYLTRTWQGSERPAAAAVGQTARNLGKSAAPLAMTALIAIASLDAAFLAMAAVALALAAAFATLRPLDSRFAPEPPAPPVVEPA